MSATPHSPTPEGRLRGPSVPGPTLRLAILLLLLFPATAAPAAAEERERPGDRRARGDEALDDVPSDLPARYREWLEEVAPLITPEERAVFLALQRDYQRQAFLRAFWQVRDPYPDSGRNELRERWEERVELARSSYPSLADDRARMLLLNGPPASRIEARCGGLLRPLEAWRYESSELVRGGFVLVFVQSQGSRQLPYRLWSPLEGLMPLLLFGPATAPEAQQVEAIREECARGDELLAALGSAVDWAELERRGAGPARPSGEWALAFAARSTELPPDAELLPARLELAFPARHQSRTVTQGVLRVPREAASAAGEGDERRFRFLVDGEVLRRGELFESFRYRFEVPADGAPSEIPLQLERLLRPGHYQLVLRLEDLNGGRFFRHEGEVAVPLLPAPLAVAETAGGAAPGPPATAEGAAAGPLSASSAGAAAAPAAETVLRLAPPPPELITGRLRVTAEALGPGVARVRFLLDGKPVVAKARPPYSVDLDLGAEPRLRTVTAIAEGRDGEELARDEVPINAGPHRFAVRLVEPRPGSSESGAPVRAQAVVDVPAGERLDRLELFVDDTLLATLYQPPFVQLLVPPAGRQVSYVRAVAHLASGVSAEALAFLTAPAGSQQIDVDLVELYTTVLDRKGRPVPGLAREDFRVREEGEPQELLRFEWVEGVPIHAAILLDTSTSMVEEIDQAERAALRFFEQLLTPRDRAAVMTFADRPRLVVPFTNDRAVLAGGLVGLEVEGETALYDSVIYSLWYFSGVRGKRALVLLSDGEDSRSRYRFEDALEYARRAGVAIYTIGLGLPAKADLARAALLRLAAETGGRSFLVSRNDDLAEVYRSIELELRSQYLLAYQSSATGEGFRRVEVEVSKPGVSAATVRGYYP